MYEAVEADVHDTARAPYRDGYGRYRYHMKKDVLWTGAKDPAKIWEALKSFVPKMRVSTHASHIFVPAEFVDQFDELIRRRRYFTKAAVSPAGTTYVFAKKDESGRG